MSGSGHGRLITFEGLDGGGKSTQIALLADWLTAQGQRVRVTSEPDGTVLGQAIGRWLRAGGESGPVPRAEALLFLAARAQHVETVIRPALAAGQVVLCSRFSHSTLAYQGYGLGLDLHALRAADALARDGVWPTGVIILDLATENAEQRRANRPPDAIEARQAAFHQRVRDGFHALAAADPERIAVVAGGGSVDEVQAAVRRRVSAWLTEPTSC